MKNQDHDHQDLSSLTMGYHETFIKLAKYRVLFISEDITDTLAAQLSAMLLYLDNENHEEMIELYINSNGGHIFGLSNIYDVMQMIKAPIKTICIGKCYSAAAVILAAGTKGQRYAFKNSSIMIHGIQCTFPIPGHDMINSKNYYEFINDTNSNIMNMLATHTGHSAEKVKKDCKEDIWMNSAQALKYGIIDAIL